MRRQSRFHMLKNQKSQTGMSLVETMIALGLLLVVAAGVLSLGGLALATTENQGHLAARTAEYAQDKMEQLLALPFCDGVTDTTVFPAVLGGQGLAGCTGPTNNPTAQAGGGLSTTAPVAGYVDYLDASGNLLTNAQNWYYIRVWQITVPAGSAGLKQISVKTQVRGAVGQAGQLPQSTVVSLKSNPF